MPSEHLEITGTDERIIPKVKARGPAQNGWRNRRKRTQANVNQRNRTEMTNIWMAAGKGRGRPPTEYIPQPHDPHRGVGGLQIRCLLLPLQSDGCAPAASPWDQCSRQSERNGTPADFLLRYPGVVSDRSRRLETKGKQTEPLPICF